MSEPSVRVTRIYRFAASHRLHSEALSPEENRKLFGKCNNPFGHGHNYVVEIAVRGPVDPASGRTLDAERLDALVREQIVGPLDHCNMNTDVPEFRDTVPTTENLTRLIERRLKTRWSDTFGEAGPALEYVKVQETKNNSFQTADR